ncbi:ROK family protein [Mycetocola reblochoni]|uniref:Predicted N-acetyl-glucosamine kinase 2, ROK family n=2 Tax=Mycetocola reblochoni TaxID=331618 RepID=A0A1R4J2Q1_9MICO|nr:ROK family protein [Mycetocola reblochoni]RLP71228.1 ROK family protein [Mycetocola reblochoni]SJN25953.1 Predicted N-acetyl-glucosamine kinase 2, ROK family [Mycetocola reblochoni REB411]
MSATGYLIGVDVGGTSMRASAVTTTGTELARHRLPTSAELDPQRTLDRLIAELRAFLPPDTGKPRAIGLGVPGHVSAGVVRRAANLGWRDHPLAALLRASTGVDRISVSNDAAATALAESAARGHRGGVLVVPLGTGVSGALVRDGVLLGGDSGAAGELGHAPVIPGGEPCACGSSGCVEAYASARSVVRRFRSAGGRAHDAADVVAAVAAGDSRAAAVWDSACDALARGIAGAVALTDPGLVVLGGGLSAAGEALREPVDRRLAELLPWRDAPRLELAVLGQEAGLTGAVALAAAAIGDGQRAP